MGTKTNQHEFLQSLTLGNVVNYCGNKLKIEVKKQRCPLLYTARYFERVGEGWQKFSVCISDYVGDIVLDCKNEIKLYETN